MEESGKNRTPDQLPREEREPLYKACDLALRSVVQQLGVKWVIAVGGFAEKRASAACDGLPSVQIVTILHPSPASPRANRGWSQDVERTLKAASIVLAPRKP